MPFESALLRDLHHGKHRNEFVPQFVSGVEYERAAEAFMNAVVVPPVRECIRANGERVRFNRRTRELGVVAPAGFLETYHRPSEKYVFLGYFQWECGHGNPKAL